MKILFNRNLIFTASILTGLLLGEKAGAMSFLNLPVLILIMTAASAQIDIKELVDIKKSFKPAITGIFLNHIAAGVIMVPLGYIFFKEEGILAGIILAAASPPGIGIMPFSVVLGADILYSAAGVIGGFLASIVIAPLMANYFIGGGLVEPYEVFITIVKLIIIPLILSRFIRLVGLKEKFKNYTGAIVNVGFGLLFIILFGVNRNMFIGEIATLLKLGILFSLPVFGLAFVLKFILKNKDIPDGRYKSILLLATIKNSLFGASVGLALIGPEAAMPGTVLTFIIILYLIFIEKVIAR